MTLFCACACGECTTQTNPAAFVGRRPEVLLLRRWMDGCHTEVKAKLSTLPEPPKTFKEPFPASSSSLSIKLLDS